MTLRLNGTTGYVELDSPATGDSSLITLPSGGNGTLGRMQLATSQASTSGTFIDFLSIPSWAKRVTVMFLGVSTTGTSYPLVQLGTSSGITTSGYAVTSSAVTNSITATSFTTGFGIRTGANTSDTVSGHFVFTLISGNTWVGSGVFKSATDLNQVTGGDVALSGTLDRVRITTVSGTPTFDAGSINILYEG